MTGEERTLVRFAINNAKRAWLERQGGYQKIEADARGQDVVMRRRAGNALAPHGTNARWHKGCRCKRCKQAHSSYTTEWAKEKRAKLRLSGASPANGRGNGGAIAPAHQTDALTEGESRVRKAVRTAGRRQFDSGGTTPSVSALMEGEGMNLHAAPGMRIPADSSPSVSALTEPGGMVPGEIPRTGRDGPDETPPGSVSAVANPVTRWPRSLGEEATVPGPELSPSASPSPNTWRPPNAAGGKP